MKRIPFFISVCALAALAAPTLPYARESNEAQIRALEMKFAAAASAKDVDAIMRAYVPDESLFVFDVIMPRQYVGAAAYRKDWSDFLATFSGPVKFEISDLAVSGDGEIAYGHSVQHVVGTDTKGHAVEFVVRVTDVYRKIKGQWLIVQEHVSVPVDMNANKPDMMSKP
ncbi:MAG TPA: nuclear transport factor 2 family protein [Rhizomicrobium sp.]